MKIHYLEDTALAHLVGGAGPIKQTVETFNTLYEVLQGQNPGQEVFVNATRPLGSSNNRLVMEGPNPDDAILTLITAGDHEVDLTQVAKNMQS
ncbi:MAG: hypothetical protein FJX71_05120 [Alphaproteobacteria bacterium]|nr:hypothetical protein [Alphaproteobacteria bacterium]